MMTAGIDVRGYSIEDNRILFVCDQRGFKDMNRVRAFLLRQPETLEFEWNNKKSVPGDIPKDEEGGDDAAADPLAKFQAMQEDAQQEAKRKARAEKKAKEEKARKAKLAKAKKERETKQKAEAAKKKAEAEKTAAAAASAASQKEEQKDLKTEL